MIERRHPLRRAVCSVALLGLTAGVVLGLHDGLRVAGGLAPGAAIRAVGDLVLVAAGAGFVLGAAEGVLLWLVSALAERTARRPTEPGFAQAVWTGVVVAPGVALVAASVFSGRRARLIPERHVYATLMGLAGIAAVVAGATVVRGAHRRLAAGTAPLLAVGSVIMPLGAFAAALAVDAGVLVRAYGWFHVVMAAITLVSLELAIGAAFLCARRAARLQALAQPRFAFAAGVLAVAGGAAGAAALRREPALLSTVFERTLHVRHVLGALPRLALPPAAEAAPARPIWASAGPRVPGHDVILVSVDALRADHLGAYGYARPTSPAVDALATHAVVFEHAYAPLPHTSFSIASLLTGKYVRALVELGLEGPHETLADVLRRYRYKTAAFFPPSVFFIDAERFRKYEDSRFGFEYAKYEFLPAEGRTDQIIRFLEQEHPQRAFVWAHYFDPHEPYTPRNARFGPRAIDRYDAEIAEVDAAIGRLVAWLDEHRPGAIVILVADHGEEFGEHGGRYHGSTLYEEQLRVPLIVRAPGIKPRRVRAPVELVDVPVTLLGLLDVPSSARMRGTDLGPLLADPPADEAGAPPVFAEIEDLRMVRSGADKLIVDLSHATVRLFDLAADPGEQHNLAAERPAVVARLRGLLAGWIADHRRLERIEEDALAKHGAIARGRLGDAAAAVELARLLGHSTPALRREAARLLASLHPGAEVAGALRQAVAADDPEVAGWASVALARQGDAAALERVRALVQEASTPPEMRVRAAVVLAERGRTEGADALGACARGGETCRDEATRKLAIAAIGRLRARDQRAALEAALSDVRLRRLAVEALGALGDGRVAPLLSRLALSDPYVDVRLAAVEASSHLDGPVARRTLRRALSDAEPAVAEAARRALERD